MSDGVERIFYSYSSRDEAFRQELEAHLAVLRREGEVSTWSFRQIGAGDAWDAEIRTQLDRATIVLLLVSSDFLNSTYILNVELAAALEKHRRGEAVVIPVVLRKCDWKASILGKLQALPDDGKPVASFRSHDDGWVQVIAGIREILQRRAVERAARAVRASRPADEIVSVQRTPCILAIEDDPEVAALYSQYFTKRGYAVTVASNGAEGMLKYQADKPFDLVLLDLNLPGVSGEEWLAWYLAKGRHETVVLIASGKGTLLRTAREAGVVALTKPFHMEELDELVSLVMAVRKEPFLSATAQVRDT